MISQSLLTKQERIERGRTLLNCAQPTADPFIRLLELTSSSVFRLAEETEILRRELTEIGEHSRHKRWI